MKHFFQRYRKLHFVGILGTGMCGLAELLLRHGFEVSGSDIAHNDIADRLRHLGAHIEFGHAKEHVEGAEVVIYSSACKPENPELVRAAELGLPAIPRAEMLGELMRLQRGIAVAGVHGKSTTSSMLGLALQEAGLDPTIIVGGRLQNSGGNTELGESDWLVAEADEFDRSFLHLMPVHAILTNLEHEHTDTYPMFTEMEDAFVQFANRVPFYGALVVCGDDAGLMQIRPHFKRPVITYGLGETNTVRAVEWKFESHATVANIESHGKPVGTLELAVPGIHNLRNALAVIALGLRIEVPFDALSAALSKFKGVARRFEQLGSWNGVTIIDDYAHHPTEVAATLSAARTRHRGRIVAVFQPHLYSRTAAFFERFGMALMLADVVLITDVYGSRELPIPGVSSSLISSVLRRNGHHAVLEVPATDRTAFVKSHVKPGDMVVFLGAGDISKTAHAMVEQS